jgi:hypothetical protein
MPDFYYINLNDYRDMCRRPIHRDLVGCLSTYTSNFAALYKISTNFVSNITSVTSLNTRVSTECVWHVSENCFGDQQLTELLQQSTDLRKSNRIEAQTPDLISTAP